MRRFLAFISSNTLLATIVGTIIGGWILAKLLAMNAPDLGGLFGALGHWLAAPMVAKRIDLITLTILSIAVGAIGFVAIFLGELLKGQERRKAQASGEPAPAAVPAPTPTPTPATRVVRATAAEGAPPAPIPADFKLTERQAFETSILKERWPRKWELEELFNLLQQARINARLYDSRKPLSKAEVARDLEQLAAAGMVEIEPLGTTRLNYRLTTQGRDWLLDARDGLHD